MSDTQPSLEGRKLIDEWQRAVERERHTSHQHTDAINGESRARKALAAWLLPKDAKPGEKFGIWERDRDGNETLFEVTIGSDPHRPEIVARRRR